MDPRFCTQLSLHWSEVALSSDGVFRHDSVYRVEASGAAHQQDFVRESVVVDGE